MTICFISKTLNPATGYGHFAFDLINNLHKKYQIEAQVAVEQGEKIFLGEKPILIKNKKLGFFLNPFILMKFCRHADIIHALDGYPYGIFAAIANIFLRKKLIITMQGTYAIEPLYMTGRSFVLKWAYRQAEYLTAISNFTKNEAEKILGRLNNITVINHGVDFTKCEKRASQVQKRIITPPYILSVGAVTKRKGYHISIPAFAKLKEKFSDLKYVIVGSVSSLDYLSEVKKIISDLRLKNDVIFMSGLSGNELANLYHYAEIFLLPSINIGHHFEGFGLVFLEAGAFGIPVVGAFGSGAEDAIKNDITGILVPQNDIEATANALIKIYSDKNLQKEMGRNNLEAAKNNTWDKVVKKYYKIYEEIIGGEGKKRWNALAKENARYFILSRDESRDERSFRKTGQEDYEKLILGDPLIKEKFINKNKTIMEIGCGIGRMTEFFANDFRKVYGFDISEEMIREGRERLRKINNIELIATDGAHFPLADNSVDLIFSYIVFQHMPKREIIEKNFKEARRVLKKDGLFKVQLRGVPAKKGTWYYGADYNLKQAEALAEKTGLKLFCHEGEGTKYFWLWLINE